MKHRIEFQVEHLGEEATEMDLKWYVEEVVDAARREGIAGARVGGRGVVVIDSAEDADRLMAIANRVCASGEGWS